MYKNFFKRRWISQEVFDYLVSLPKMFRVYYTVDVNGCNIEYTIRDEDGFVMKDIELNARRVTGIGIQYQEDGFRESYSVFEYLDKNYVPFIKAKFDKFIAKYPSTKSDLKAKELYELQHKLRNEIERVTSVKTAYDGKNLIFNLAGISQEARERVVNLVRRLDDSCVPVTLCITMSGATDEEIGATLNELAMYEVESTNVVEDNEEF
jgi:hypothetical protein